MVYDSTKSLLGSIIRSLETADEAAWDDRLELGGECLYEMSQMTRYQPCRRDPADPQWSRNIPDCEKARRAMQQIKLMMTAIRHRDQTTALENARAALAAM